ncbi:MAG TPA: ABC transporter permease [Calditrichae bacterium]|nr:ABC transporter permease [Calditrichia bacterium]
MRNFFTIMGWEFGRHLRSRSFAMATLIPPLLFAAIILVFLFFYQQQNTPQPRVIGCVELDTVRYCPELHRRLQERQAGMPSVILVTIQGDTTPEFRQKFSYLQRLKAELDSLNDAYNKIKERRRYIFQQPRSAKRERLLRTTYEQLHLTREQRDLAELEYTNNRARVDSAWNNYLIQTADSMLRSNAIEGYILLDPEEFQQGIVEFHSQTPSNFLQIEPIRQVLQEFLIEFRLRQAGISSGEISQFLQPVEIREILMEGHQRREFNFMLSYLGPVIIVVFLFVSIFTPSGFLFFSLISERKSRLIEILLTSASPLQIIAGKIIGLGFLGLVQIFVWIGITIGVIMFYLPGEEFWSLFTWQHLLIFILYFSLGYLFFGAIYVAIGSLFDSEESAHHINLLLRMLAISPILLAVPILLYPNAWIVRILSFIPFLTPTFMILRTPLGHPPLIDYYISTGVMVVSIIMAIVLGAQLFKLSMMWYGKNLRFRDALKLLRGL